MLVEIDLFGEFETTVPYLAREIWVSRNFAIVLPKMDARDRSRDRRRDNSVYEAENEQLLGRIIEIEKLQGVVRLLQTQIVLLEWLIPQLEDLRINRSNLDIIMTISWAWKGSCSIDPVKCEDRYLHGITEHWIGEISWA